MTSTLQTLHREYETLAAPGIPVSADQLRGVEVFLAEQRLQSDGRWTETQRDRVDAWAARVIDLTDFVDAFGRMPRENNRLSRDQISRRERTLAEWVRYQRREKTRRSHSSYQRRRLLAIDGFHFTPHLDKWFTQLDEASAFRDINRRAPKFRSSDPSERRLARWEAEQRRLYRAGMLVGERLEVLAQSGLFNWLV